jgi:hypothetical protein
MRLITEDNIEQLENMTYSNNIDKLMFTKNIEPQEIVNEIKLTLRTQQANINKNLLTPKRMDEEFIRHDEENQNIFYNTDSPDYPDTSPAYNPSFEEEIPHNEDDSPPYNPFSASSPEINGPRTPSMSPPEKTENPQNQLGGEIIEQYTTGEEVLFRGDFLPNRIWKIKSVGDRFITITTDNIEGLDDKDTIKVVRNMEIYRPADFTYNQYSLQTTSPYSGQAVNQHIPTMNYGINEGTPAINFAPVFKIMNGGNDFSSGEPTNESNHSNNSIITNKPHEMNTITDLAIASNQTIHNSAKSNSDKIGGASLSDKQEPVDFSKLIIKKV